MKYVMGHSKLTGYFMPVVFPDELIHKHVAASIKKDKNVEVVSAGFVSFKDGRWRVSDEISTSLKMGPEEEDETVLNLFLGMGLAGLALSNMLSFIQMKGGK